MVAVDPAQTTRTRRATIWDQVPDPKASHDKEIADFSTRQKITVIISCTLQLCTSKLACLQLAIRTTHKAATNKEEMLKPGDGERRDDHISGCLCVAVSIGSSQ